MEIFLFDKQNEAFSCPARFILTRTGIQGGKTYLGSVWLMNEIYSLYQKGYVGDFLIAAPTNKVLEQSTLKKFRPMFPPDWGVWNEQKRCFKLNWKNKDGEHCFIFVRSTDDPGFLEGMTLLAAWLDEAGNMKEEAWVNIQGRLSIFQGRCIMTTTPYAGGWTKREITKRVKDGDTDYAEFRWSSIDNPYFPKAEYERMRRVLSPATFRRRYQGDYTRPEGLVYPDFIDEEHIVEPFEIPSYWKKFAGMDFGRRDPTAILSIAEDPDSHIFYIYKEFYKRKATLAQMAKHMHEYVTRYTLADWSAAQVIDELRRKYLVKNIKNADKGPGSIDIGIERITGLLREGRLKVFRGQCRNTVDEFESYHHKEEVDDIPSSDKPVDTSNHAMDALRYAFSKVVKGLYRHTAQRTVRQRVSRRVRQVDSYTGY